MGGRVSPSYGSGSGGRHRAEGRITKSAEERPCLGPVWTNGRRITIAGLETRGFKEYGGTDYLRTDHLRHRKTAGTGTLCETQHLSKGVFKLHRGEREPFLKGGQEQKIVGATKMQPQDRRGHIVPFHTISMVLLYLSSSGVENCNALGRCLSFPS